MTELVLVRHGETDWNAQGRIQGSSDIPLNQRGDAQAKSAADALRSEQWDAMYASPLSRAFQTAVYIAEALGIEESQIIQDVRLQERDYGQAEGLTFAERHDRFPKGIGPDGETTEQLDVRSGSTIREIAESNAGKRIVIVSHGGWIRSALRVITDHDPLVSHIVLPNASRTYVSFENDEWHLGPLAVEVPLIIEPD